MIKREAGRRWMRRNGFLDKETMTNKQECELYYAEPILKHLDLYDFVQSSDSPDLLISKDNRMIGIEVVTCYPDEEGDGSYNALESRVYKVCREYSKKLKREGVRGLFGTVSFTEAAYRVDRTVSTHCFKQIVFEEIERKSEQYRCEQKLNLGEDGDDYFAKMVAGVFDCKYVDSVSWHQLSDCELVEFTPIKVGYCLTIDPKYVVSCINKKDMKLSQFKAMPKNKSINEYWLFISNPINTFRDLEDFTMPTFETAYNQVYITDFRKVMRLK